MHTFNALMLSTLRKQHLINMLFNQLLAGWLLLKYEIAHAGVHHIHHIIFNFLCHDGCCYLGDP